MPTHVEELARQRRAQTNHRLTVGIGCLAGLLLLLMIADKAYDLFVVLSLTDCKFG
ncbi:hypothetical protein [Pseudomonas aeruginosa]|uniref:hypothetical protein n=1 Tax=Pseudomonas aeruginosa TaxID=287 RepID=UPI003CC60D31|nr:hypothetical protein [Pseudomonas aeruginosa]